MNRFDTATFLSLATVLLLSACTTAPTVPFDVEVPPGVDDARGRFAEIFCSVLERDGGSLPDYRPCADALTEVTIGARGTGRTVDLGRSHRRYLAAIVPGVGYSCIAQWLQPATTPRLSAGVVVPLRGERTDARGLRVQREALSWTKGQIERGYVDALPSEEIPARVLASPDLGRHFDLEASPSFVESVVRAAHEAVKRDRRMRGLPE